jgi:hypothetical protein
MWQAAALQAIGAAVGGPDPTAGPAKSGAEGAAYSADGYTVTTGGSKASGATVARGADPMMVGAAGVAAAATNWTPIALAVGAVAVVLLIAKRRK